MGLMGGWKVYSSGAGAVGALTFNATADAIGRATADTWTADAFTISAWCRPSTAATTKLWTLRSNTYDNPSVGWDATGWRAYDEAVVIATGPAAVTGQWTFVTFRRNGSTLTLSIGTETGAVTHYSGTVFNNFGPTFEFWTGGRLGVAPGPGGDLALFRVWDAVLSDAEVEAERTSATPARTAGLFAAWDMDSAASPGADSSGNGRTLTNGGGGSWEEVAGPAI